MTTYIKFFKLTNGEEFIAESIESTEPGSVAFVQPVVLQMTGKGQPNFVLWCALRENREFSLPLAQIMLTGDVSEGVIREYQRLFKPEDLPMIQPATTVPIAPTAGFGSIRMRGARSMIETSSPGES